MSKWVKVWSVHDDSDISLPSDCGERGVLPHTTTDMMLEAISTFKWKTAAGPSRIQPRSLCFLGRQGLDAMASFFMKCECLLAWPAGRAHSEMARIPKDGGGTRLVALIHTIVRVWARVRRPLITAVAEEVPLGDDVGKQAGLFVIGLCVSPQCHGCNV
eukprot:7027507-Pyramimonas_sp.AAC.2